MKKVRLLVLLQPSLPYISFAKIASQSVFTPVSNRKTRLLLGIDQSLPEQPDHLTPLILKRVGGQSKPAEEGRSGRPFHF